MAEIKIGQRYWFHRNRHDAFIGEVVGLVGTSQAELKVVQDLGYGRSVGYIWPHESVLMDSYELLIGQEAPTT